VSRLSAVMPGFTPEMFGTLFDVFSDPLRSTSLAILRRAALIPDARQPNLA